MVPVVTIVMFTISMLAVAPIGLVLLAVLLLVTDDVTDDAVLLVTDDVEESSSDSGGRPRRPGVEAPVLGVPLPGCWL